MLDLGAPIEAGRSAAGLEIGDSIAHLSDVVEKPAKHLGHGVELFDFGPVALWVRDGVIDQIGVRDGYSGFVLGTTIGIGASLQEVQDALGIVTEDDEDALVVAQTPGLCFETEGWRSSPRTVEGNRDAKLTGIFVFAVTS